MKRYLLTTLCAAALLGAACSETRTAQVPAPAGVAALAEAAPDEVIKSPLDEREYLFRELPNGLKVVVVSDPDADKAAASLDVHIGHMADPADREGLSHFLEHMLFLGTGKYPEVGEYGEFIERHGGSNNAGTGQEHTSYFFSIDNDQLEPALDRFSRFFIDPLFDAEFLEKERNAVESEYSLKVREDARRYREAVKQTANPDHPFTQFSVGNLDTLSDTEGETILDAVKAQYERYYSADIMALAIVGDYPVEQMMDWAEAKFADAPSKGDTRNAGNRPEPYLDSQKGVEIRVNVLEDEKSVRLDFALPPASEHYRTKPVAYLRNLITHQGEGTLYDTLKAKGYLKNLYVATWGPHDFASVRVNFDLTDEGYANADAVVGQFFAYVDMIREGGITPELFAELGRISDQNFTYSDKFGAAGFAESLSSNLQHYPPNHIVDIGRTYYDFDQDLIRSYLDGITPDTVRVIKADPEFDSDTREERYDVAYAMTPLPAETIARWEAAEPADGLRLPEPNPYIAEDLALNTAGVIAKPAQAMDEPGLSLWYVNDNAFELPKAALNLRLYSPVAYDSDAHKAAIGLHAAIVRDMMTTESYAASQAGLYYGVFNSSRSLNITVQGYNDKIDVFLDRVLDTLDVARIDEATFERVRENVLTDLRNQAFARPINQVFGELSSEIFPDGLSREAQIAALEALDFDTFRERAEDLLRTVTIEGLYVGNVSEGDTRAIGKQLKARLGDRLSPGGKLDYRTVDVPPAADLVREVAVDHNDSTLVWALQGEDDSYAERARFALLTQLLGQRFYKSLRTEQQYGYVVGLTDYSIDETPALLTYIQSPVAHPVELRRKVDEFYAEQADYLATLDEATFASNVEGLLSSVNKAFDNVYAQGNTLHSDLIAERYEFDNREKLTEAIRALSREDIAQAFEARILSPERRSLTLWNIGTAHAGEAGYVASDYNICSAAKCVAEALD